MCFHQSELLFLSESNSHDETVSAEFLPGRRPFQHFVSSDRYILHYRFCPYLTYNLILLPSFLPIGQYDFKSYWQTRLYLHQTTPYSGYGLDPWGGLAVGGTFQYDGWALVAYQNVVVVVIQYRLSILGFLRYDLDNISPMLLYIYSNSH